MRRLILPLLTLLLLAALPTGARAQFIETRSLSLDGARQILAGARAEAQANGWNVAISVVDPAGNQLVFERMDGVGAVPAELALAKARSSARFGAPTAALAEAVEGGNLAFLAFDGVMPLEGGIPVMVDGQVVAAVGVSGVMANQDAQIAQAGIDALLR